MTDEFSKKNDHQKGQKNLNDEQFSAASSSDDINLDHLQEEFNSLVSSEPQISEQTPPYVEPTDHLQKELNSFENSAPSAKPQSSEQSSPYVEAADAFNDLADAFTMDTSAPTANPAMNDNDFSAHLDKSLQELESISPKPILRAPASNQAHFDTSLIEPSFPNFDNDAGVPASSRPISGQAIPGQASPDQISSSPSEIPLHADLSGNRDIAGRPKSHIIAFASAILIATVGGIYWYTMGSTEQAIQIVEGEQLTLPEQSERDIAEKPELKPLMPAISERSEQSEWIDSDLAKVEPLTPSKVAISKPVETALPTTLSTADAIKLITQKHATNNTPATEPMPAIEPAANTPPVAVKTLAAVKSPVPVQVTAPRQKSLATPTGSSGEWIIIAPVISKPSAQRYVKGFTAKQIDSDIMQTRNSGRNKYFVRIKGFSSEKDAQKQIKRLSMRGLRNAKVLRATDTLTGSTTVPVTTKSLRAAKMQTPQRTPKAVYQAQTRPAKKPSALSTKVETSTKTQAPTLNNQVQVISEEADTPLTSGLNSRTKQTVSAQRFQQVSEIDLDDAFIDSATQSSNKSGRQISRQVTAVELDDEPIRTARPARFQQPTRSNYQQSRIGTIKFPPASTPAYQAIAEAPALQQASPPAFQPSTAPKKTLSVEEAARAIYRSKAPANSLIFKQKAKSGHQSITPAKVRAVKQASKRPMQNITGSWFVMAPAASYRVASDHADTFSDQYMQSEVIALNQNGKEQYFVLIKGFTTQDSANKRRDRLAKTVGLKNATVEQF